MEDCFVFSGEIYFLVTPGIDCDTEWFENNIENGIFRDSKSGEEIEVVYIFSDRFLAEDFLAKHGLDDGSLVPYTPPSDTKLIDVLLRIKNYGYDTFSIDSGSKIDTHISVDEAVRQIRDQNR